MKTLVSLAVLVLAAGCVPQTSPDLGVATVSTSSDMPKGIRHADGQAPVMVSVTGQARCQGLTPAQNAYALGHVNTLRASAGLAPLRLESRLQQAAEQQACDMAARGVMEHRGSASTGPKMRAKRLGYRPRIIAENIAAGATSLFGVEGTMQAWTGSSKHRANMLLRQARDMGIGHAKSPDGRVSYWSAVFAASK
ncbi:CAP domain-containing protein [Paracoccus sp. (in: a-proteobacteria)]|uniref:CAP domain-containing protein n=1 Tax=Paracoccus sp. TaxID=267 RepID=UPI00322019F7